MFDLNEEEKMKKRMEAIKEIMGEMDELETESMFDRMNPKMGHKSGHGMSVTVIKEKGPMKEPPYTRNDNQLSDDREGQEDYAENIAPNPKDEVAEGDEEQDEMMAKYGKDDEKQKKLRLLKSLR